MTLDTEQAAGCTGKQQYMSKGAAVQTLRRIEKQKRDNRPRVELNVYRCRFCGAFHIGGA